MITKKVILALCCWVLIIVSLETEAKSLAQIPQGTSQNTQPLLNSHPCGDVGGNFSLTPDLWNSNGIDQYIAQHPTAKNQTIAEFAASLGMPNFYCGIGLECMAGQMCYPAIGKDYLIIYAIQQWNNFMNQLYDVTASIIMSLSDTSAMIVTEFIPYDMKIDGSIFGWAIGTLVVSIIGTFTGPFIPVFLPAKAVLSAEAVTNAARVAQAAPDSVKMKDVNSAMAAHDASEIIKLVQGAGGVDNFPKANAAPAQVKRMEQLISEASGPSNQLMKRDLAATSTFAQSNPHLRKRGPPNVLSYTRWSFLDIHLGRLRTRIQNFISLNMKIVLSSPIYSDAGIAPSLAKGMFMAPNPTWKTTIDETKKLGTIVLLSEFFVSVGYIATIGQDPCNGKGPGGAWPGKNVLSHCDEKGIMRSIVMVREDKLKSHIQNAHLLESKYGYKVYDLVNRAAQCQNKFGVYGSNNASTPVKESSDCAFQLVVCDMTTEGMKNRLKSKKARKHKARACREEFKLPI